MNKERQLQYDKAYMKMAYALSELSYSHRSKVGCIIVSPNGQVISQGFNGTPTGYDNCCEDAKCTCQEKYGCIFKVQPVEEVLNINYCTNPENIHKHCQYLQLTTKPEVLHAESNAISKCAKWISSTEGATLYVTLSPCFDCAKTIIQAGIKRVCYLELYRDISGVEFLKKNNIIVEQINI